MRKSQLIATMILLIASLTTAAFADEAASRSSVAGVVNINTADATQLAYLPGIGAKAAQRIVEYREQHGPFAKTTDLMQVKGIGDKSFERLSAYLVVEGKTTLSSNVESPRKPRAKSQRKQPANTASE